MLGKAVGMRPAQRRSGQRPLASAAPADPQEEEHPVMTTEERELFDGVRELLAATVEDLSVEDVELDSSLRDDLGVDSLARLELVAAIEDHWQIEVPVEDAERLATVRQIIDHLATVVPAPAGEPS
jgi:acyl carrier protein